MINLTALYQEDQRIVVTSHRGFSGRYPENTITAFKKAVEIGTDLIEFDLRGTKDREPVILHDPFIERTSTGTGPVGDHSLDELRKLDFAGGNGPRVTIPTFQEALDAIPETVGLNIQVKETDRPLLDKICSIYAANNLTGRAYLTVSTFADAEAVRAVASGVDLCILERKQVLNEELLKKMADFGCRFAQPHRRDMTPELCDAILRVGLFANVFFSNTDEDNRRFIGYGIKGIMTDFPDILLKTIVDVKEEK